MAKASPKSYGKGQIVVYRTAPVVRTAPLTPPRIIYRQAKSSRKRKPAPKPTAGQVAKGALGAMAVGVPVGLAGAAVMMSLDVYAAKKKTWAPPIVGWRGVAGAVVFVLGLIFRSPATAIAGVLIFSTSLPQAFNSMASAMSGMDVQLPGISGQRVGFGLGSLKRGLQALLGGEHAREEVEEQELEEVVRGAVDNHLREQVAGGGAGHGGGQG